jgi:hypothetical protein
MQTNQGAIKAKDSLNSIEYSKLNYVLENPTIMNELIAMTQQVQALKA